MLRRSCQDWQDHGGRGYRFASVSPRFFFFRSILAAQALIEMGEAMKQMADVKYSLDDNIKQNFLEPLHHLQTKDLKEVMVRSLEKCR